MEELKSILNREQCSCVVCQNNVIYMDNTNGIRPLLRFYQEGKLQDARVVDKVIGKAAAMILVHGGITALHAQLISEHALRFLNQFPIRVTYDEVTPYIMNRDHSGMCPMEQLVIPSHDVEEAYQLLLKKVHDMQA